MGPIIIFFKACGLSLGQLQEVDKIAVAEPMRVGGGKDEEEKEEEYSDLDGFTLTLSPLAKFEPLQT